MSAPGFISLFYFYSEMLNIGNNRSLSGPGVNSIRLCFNALHFCCVLCVQCFITFAFIFIFPLRLVSTAEFLPFTRQVRCSLSRRYRHCPLDPIFHSLHVFSALGLLLFLFLYFVCPLLPPKQQSSQLELSSQSAVIISHPSGCPPPHCQLTRPSASIHPVLDGLYPAFLAFLPSQRRSLVLLHRPSYFNCHTASFLVYFTLLLCGDIQLNPGPDTSTSISYACLNVRSASSITDDLNKPAVLHEFISDNSLELLSLTETWLSPDTPPSTLNGLTPPHFSIIHKPRPAGRGGGLALIYRSYLKLSEITFPSYTSFEALGVQFTVASKHFTLLTIYRPPSSSPATFLDELSVLLADFCSRPNELLISGDFNIHVDDLSAPYTNSFLDLLDSLGLQQHVNFPTHNSGHSLDLLVSRTTSNVIHNVTRTFPALSDHFAILASLAVPAKDIPVRTTKTIRPLRSINSQQFSNDILSSSLYTSPATNLSDYATQFTTVLTNLLDKHAPAKTISCSSRPHQPFITPEIRAAKSKRSQLERIYRKAKTDTNLTNFKNQATILSKLISKSKSEYFRQLISSTVRQPRKLWSTLNTLLSRTSDPKLPSTIPFSDLPSTFLNFFQDKITKLRSGITSTISSPHIPSPLSPPPLINFTPATPDEVRMIILSSNDSTCSLDILPTRLLKSCLDSLLHPITTLINLSLSESTFPASYRHAQVTPLLKKFSLPKDDLSSYRPISNLNFISKILERIVSNRLVAHLNSFPSISPFQSAYRKFHSTETALLRIQNDLLLAMENKRVSALVLLDLSSAFDTVDHKLLLSRLSLNFGISGPALSFLTSYLSDRSQAVHICSNASSSSPVHSGVPQGSVLGPLLFSLYTTPLSYVLQGSAIPFHFYADDTQLYISFSASDSLTSLAHLSKTLDSVHQWLSANHLSLNPSKTEYLLVGTTQQRAKVTADSLSFSGNVIHPSTSVRNLGVIFDPELSLTNHISAVCKSSYYAIRQLRQVRSSLDHNSAVLLANSLVSTKLDYCNSLYYGLPQTSLRRLQLVQNTLARAVVPFVKRSDHISPVLHRLHWLPINQRIHYKICSLTYKTLQDRSPSYLFELLTPHVPSRSLRSSNQHLLSTPLLRSSAGRRSFSFAAPTLWNSLPLDVRLSTSLSSFRSRLKTFLYPP